MHVLVATDGSLEPAPTTELARRLAGDDGKVTVLTVVEIPRTLLADLRRVYGESEEVLILDHETVDVRGAGQPPKSAYPGDEAMIDRYLNDTAEARTGPLAEALRAAGVDTEVAVVEAENSARAILDAVKERSPDVVCVGSTGRGRFEGFLGSVGQKVARMAPVPVLVVR